MKALAQVSSITQAAPKGGVYYLVSPDSFLKSMAVKQLRSFVLDDQDDDFNVDDVDARDAGGRIVELARNYPMMASMRWVHCYNAELLKDKDVGDILKYLEDPAKHTFLCLSSEKLDKRTKLYKAIKKAATLIEIKQPTQKEMPSWVMQRAKSKHLSIDSQAAHLLAEIVGSNLHLIERAIEQLQNYIEPEKVIIAKHVEGLVCRSSEASIFELSDAIGNKNLSTAMKLLKKMELDGEQPLMILSMIARHVRLLLRVKIALQKRSNEVTMAKALALPPFVVKKLVEQSRKHSRAQLILTVETLFETDLLVRQSRQSGYGAIQQVIFQMGLS